MLSRFENGGRRRRAADLKTTDQGGERRRRWRSVEGVVGGEGDMRGRSEVCMYRLIEREGERQSCEMKLHKYPYCHLSSGTRVYK